jgi:iron complex outermembrane recepter protein
MHQRLARIFVGALSAAAVPSNAYAADRNAIQAATDAFGVSVGIEKIGLYTSDQVRGFSPTAAGNLRIDGLYFDQAGELNKRLTDRSTIRVGIAAQAYPFPAPTGIVDYRLRSPGTKFALSSSAGFADYSGPYFDADLQIPIVGSRLGLVAGFGRKDDEFPDGTNSSNRTTALLLEGRPIAGLRLRSFWTQIVGKDVEAQPVLTVGGAWLPPELKIRRFIGQEWAANEHHITNTGILADIEPKRGWTLRGGLFRSVVEDSSNFADLFTNVQVDGTADHRIVADPREGTRSTSGELRLSHLIDDGPRRHLIYVILRGRVRSAEFGGSGFTDFGSANVTVPKVLPKPDFQFTSQNQDRVHQLTAGIAYEGYWNEVGQIGFGIQKTWYRKTFEEPGKTPTQTNDSPLLFFGSLEVHLSKRFALFGGITRGLEETGIAPDNAANRGQALAAARTRQIDGGLSFSLTGNLKVVAAAFDIRKPYFNLDSTNVYTVLGTEQHRGIEFSLTGSVTPRLNIVAGAVLLDARTTGPAVNEGRIGKRPINSSPRLIRLNAEYSLPWFGGVSVDVGIDHDGERVASTSNALVLPARTIFRAGGRYRFQLNRLNAHFRILVDNIADHFSWALTSGGGFKVDVGRRVTGYLAVDL